MLRLKHLRHFLAAMAIVASAITLIPAISASATVSPSGHSSPHNPRYNYGPWTVVNSPGTYDSSPNRNHSNGHVPAGGV